MIDSSSSSIEASAPSIEARLAIAVGEGLEPNFRRWLEFASPQPEWIELQALACREGHGARNRFAHAEGADAAVRLLAEGKRFGATGLYVIANRLHPSVASRAAVGAWHNAVKGASTTDRDITARRVLFIDVDAERPSSTSATDAEMARTVPVAQGVYDFVARVLGDTRALAYGQSGNGRQVFVALNGLDESPTLAATIRDILQRLAARFKADGAKIDASVCDAKRLVPAFGTIKSKGVHDDPERPHRPTALVTADSVRRLSFDELCSLRDALPAVTTERRDRVERARQAPANDGRGGAPDLFTAANAVPVNDVLTWLALRDGVAVRCPGCGNTQGVGPFGNGLKCFHDTCANSGPAGSPGFRTPVDLVMAVHHVDARTAAAALAEHFKLAPPEGFVSPSLPFEMPPTILVDHHEERVANEAVRALARDPRVFARGGALVHILRDETKLVGVTRTSAAPRIVVLPQPRLRELLSSAAVWVRETDEGEKRCYVPAETVKAVASRGSWPELRTLEGVVETPVLRPDGTLLTTPGYDAATGLLYMPNAPYPDIPAEPDSRAACEAVRTLLEVIEDFPFKGQEHRSAWLAALLTPLARYAFRGPAPLMLFEANVRGAGKSLLTDIISEIVCGRPMARMTQADDDAEERKRITTVAVAGYSTVLIDNITKPFGTGALDAALTAEHWNDRLLGSNTEVRVPLWMTWYATGNNVTVAADTSRRILPVRIESPEERPEQRRAFKHPKLTEWVREQRPRLTAAAVTFLRAYMVAGAPDMGISPWGSFEGFGLVRNALVWIGLPDPAATREAFVSFADREAGALEDLIAAWEEMDGLRTGLTVQTVLTALDASPGKHERMRSAIAELVPTPPRTLPSARSLGMRIQHLRGRVVGGKCIDRANGKSPVLWRVVRATSAAEAAPSPPRADGERTLFAP